MCLSFFVIVRRNPIHIFSPQLPHQLFNPTGTSLCSLTDETRIPKFFRVTEQVFAFYSTVQNYFSPLRTVSTSPEPPSPPYPSSLPSRPTRPPVRLGPSPTPTLSSSTSPLNLSSTITSSTGGSYTGIGLFNEY